MSRVRIESVCGLVAEHRGDLVCRVYRGGFNFGLQASELRGGDLVTKRADAWGILELICVRSVEILGGGGLGVGGKLMEK